ncbi:carboxylesterase family protein [Leeuwenhoekiella marinoflava]|uniref:Pimeloyl-ACP methyl ester carboxylesterase n=2 Tax=Leeuwenhoekiella marinoflava TaxID=988 RepID=A0A4Q0PRJ1_9FLAO|nr:alpha/beta hydrolase [Leeuwenhoekiella marinoflava]RXG33231.1 pimeloyl-ACP methyl ester carboxylesterase [Leeuwenhoekiella marinoflava]SHE43605.1 Pimeloyl-ACP methyl ester carboxylesterase [Leeuwenhoekiella marinoflava DSM 3653]
MKFSWLLYSLLTITSFSFAQTKQGNIVQYFGKEKVEDVNEGTILHLFNEGLILNKKGFSYNTDAVSRDPVFAEILNKEVNTPIQEIKIIDSFSGETLEWKPIKTKEKNEFNDKGLRSGYLYLEYNSKIEQTVIFDASGHTNVLINGLPHEGDHYDFGWNLIPIKLNKGKNEFILSGGRFSNMRARLLKADQPIQFTKRDLTLPDLLIEESKPLLGAIRVMNATDEWFINGKIHVKVGHAEITTTLPNISPLIVRKVPFKIPVPNDLATQKMTTAFITLLDKSGNKLSIDTLELSVKSKYKHHKNTFISHIDGSVQYYSLAPSLTKDKDNQALFLSVHGASVEAVNQANAYKQKDWGHLVAPTNRRPYGFAWEDWGRLDALEVLDEAEKLLKTDKQHTYLTGHSMGGHGTWYLGATYPDRFAAIAPCAGYPDLLLYRNNSIKRMKEMPAENFDRFGITKDEFLKKTTLSFNNETDALLDSMIRRAGNPSRTLKLKRNYLHYGVYVLHGEKDNVVPTSIARDMRARLGTFHNDFSYYEYPDGTHWYGDESVDYPLLFDFFKARKIKKSEDIDEIEFYTGSPGVSASSHYVSIIQQEKPFEISSFLLKKEKGKLVITTLNTALLQIDLQDLKNANDTLVIDNQQLVTTSKETIYLKNNSKKWTITTAPSASKKGPDRNGGFKDAFRNNMVFVYASNGSNEENEWYYNRAKFDAEKFWYRANGSVEVVRDRDFKASSFPNQNIIIYGNKSNNTAWNKLLKDCPIQVTTNTMKVGSKSLTGNTWGALFIYPRKQSPKASIGVVTGTGIEGMKAAYANDYLENGTTFPDVLIFDKTMITKGIEGVKASGFFGNDWSVEEGDFIWR